jgi:soluble lytic murein transglycosylase-like protein
MNRIILLLCLACGLPVAGQTRVEAEYYAQAYANHYGIPADFLRAVIAQESNWRPCAVSSKGATGLMQLMPATAALMHLADACDIRQNLSAGVRHLAYLLNRFHGDLRLAAAAYYAGEKAIMRCQLACSNREVVSYVHSIRIRYAHLSEPARASVSLTRRQR